MIKGVGIDIVETARLSHAMGKEGFNSRVYTANELAAGRKLNLKAMAFWAGRWAAKEAVSKALGCGIGEHCSFQDIEVTNNEHGAPIMNCSGQAAERMRKMGATKIFLSISHERTYAVAQVILEGE